MLESSMLLNIQQPFPKLENTILIPASPDKVETDTAKMPSVLFPCSNCHRVELRRQSRTSVC